MSQWQRELNIKDVWESRDAPLIAKTIAERLSKMAPLGMNDLDYTKDDLAGQFSDLANDPSCDTEEFDYLMRELYDWADTSIDGTWNGKKLCWITTF